MASKNLERHLHEEDDYRRRQENERQMNKDKPPRYNGLAPVFAPIFTADTRIDVFMYDSNNSLCDVSMIRNK